MARSQDTMAADSPLSPMNMTGQHQIKTQIFHRHKMIRPVVQKHMVQAIVDMSFFQSSHLCLMGCKPIIRQPVKTNPAYPHACAIQTNDASLVQNFRQYLYIVPVTFMIPRYIQYGHSLLELANQFQGILRTLHAIKQVPRDHSHIRMQTCRSPQYIRPPYPMQIRNMEDPQILWRFEHKRLDL